LRSISTLILLFFCLLNICSQSIDSAYKFFDNGRYEQAAREFEKLLPLVERKFGPNDTSLYSYLLLYAGVSFEKSNQYAKAEQYYVTAGKIYERIDALSSGVYITAINKLAELYRITGSFEKAETLFMQAIEKNKEVFGENSSNYINILNNIAQLYQKTGKYDKAEQYYIQALETSRRAFGDSYPGNAALLNNISSLYHKLGNFGKAEPIYMEALKISEKVFGEENQNTVSLLNNLGALYDDMGNYEKAESIYLRTLKIREKVVGTQHHDYAISANNLAQLYYKTGNYEKSELLYRKALEIIEKTYGKEHFSYALGLNNLGALYFNMGNFEKAEYMYNEALKIRKKVFGERHPEYATSLNNMALFYQETGNYEKAGSYFEQASRIRREILGDKHPDYASTLNNMALFYYETGNYQKTEALLLEALDIRKNSLGEEHPDYAVSLNNIALYYCDMGNYQKAEPLFLRALKIREKFMGEMSTEYAAVLNNLAGLYDSMDSYEKAETLYSESAEIIRKVCGENHPAYASAINNLAMLYQKRGYLKKAEPLYQQAMNTYLSQIRQQFSFLSESEKEKYLERIRFFFKSYQNFIFREQLTDPSISGKAYDIELSEKGVILRSDRQLRTGIQNSGDSAAVRIYDSWMAVRASLSRQYSIPAANRAPGIKMMESRANDLEKQLTRLYSGRSDMGNLQNTRWQDIKKQLKPHEIAIEFTSFPFYNGRKWTDSTMYAALLLRKNDIYPVIVQLFEARQLDRLLNREGSSDLNFINDLYRWENRETKTGPGKGQQLYYLIWKPLEKYLSGIGTVYFSPSGRLHQLSFAAIPSGTKELLSDRYDLYQLSSTSEIVNIPTGKPPEKIILYGGIEYDADIGRMDSIAGRYRHHSEKNFLNSRQPGNREADRGGSWIFLDGTMNEIGRIRKLAEDKGIKSVIYSGDKAIEESFKNLSGKSSPEVIHIATHGFFFPDVVRKYNNTGLAAAGERGTQTFKLSDNPLMRSGLAFAGANHAWSGEELPPELDDGILTAYEVSGMYLPDTRLVVLSACETGLGEIKGSEGVFGLQRSFKMAGAEYILMSLWQIPDYQTSELMNRFYSEWFAGHTIQQSLKTAQDFMKNKYPFQPFMWAAFVLLK
jgi:tetratricopeptide (TPR) repeat protein/CHAT domain-containing protein